MYYDEFIIKAYELIQNNKGKDVIRDNIELFKTINRRISIVDHDSKLIEVYKYILASDIDELEFPYFKDRIFEAFNRYEQYITQRFYLGYFTIEDKDIEKLYDFMEQYNEFKKYDKDNKLYSRLEVVRDCTGAMMIALNKGFMNLSLDTIKRMLDTIRNNDYLKAVVAGSTKKGLLDEDYLNQYLSRFLYVLDFNNCDNDEGIEKDYLIDSLFNGTIKDVKFLKKALKYIDGNIILDKLDYNISSYVKLIESTFSDEAIQQELFNILYDKTINDNVRDYLKYIMIDKNYDKYIDEKRKEHIIEWSCYEVTHDFSDDEMLYLINNCTKLNILRLNVYEHLKSKTLSDEIKQKLLEIANNAPNDTYDVEFMQFYLDKIFQNDEKIGTIKDYPFMMMIRNIIKEYLISLGYKKEAEEVKIFFACFPDNTMGCFSGNNFSITINPIPLFRFVKASRNEFKDDPKLFEIFENIFHEVTHYVQRINCDKDEVDDVHYRFYKETILCNNYDGYYDRNYKNIFKEKDARVTSYKVTYEMLEKYFPYLKNTISHYKNLYEKELEFPVDDKVLFELSKKVDFDELFDRFILLNPALVKKYPLLQREYNMDGTKKTIDGIKKVGGVK